MADTTLDLVLDYLSSKGFSDAEAALRSQLASVEPAPPTEGISPLELMLIRGRAAAQIFFWSWSSRLMAPWLAG